MSLGRPVVPQGGLLVSFWRPLGCVGCLLRAPWCPKVVLWVARGWLFGSLGAAWCVFWWPSRFLADSFGVSGGWAETQQHKNWGQEQSKRKRDTPTRTQHPLQNRASRSMTHRFWVPKFAKMSTSCRRDARFHKIAFSDFCTNLEQNLH